MNKTNIIKRAKNTLSTEIKELKNLSKIILNKYQAMPLEIAVED